MLAPNALWKICALPRCLGCIRLSRMRRIFLRCITLVTA
ncbi:Uncharacterised protein [Vibrio cholerae]|nr:Uncharacterised protein [Vibrio cholerae]